MRTALTLVLMLALGCSGASQQSGGAAQSIDNPTGACKAPNDGSRAGYHSAGSGIWLLDCNNTLAREYWRVFAQSATSAYVIPRPDGASYLRPVCASPEHELHERVKKYALCEPASSEAEVERVNDIAPADALAITHFLHTALEFVATGSGIAPFPIPSDILDACDLHPEQNSAELAAICERERKRLETGHDIGFSYEGPGAVELALRLNELYGVK
jgi:hypothetical protein